MKSLDRPLAWALLLGTVIAVAASPVRAADHLLLTEFSVTPTNAEFVEIYNPTANSIDLEDYYLSDFVLASDLTQDYWRIVDGALIPSPGFANDFLVHFPAGSSIHSGQTLVISIHDDALFTAAWSTGGRIIKPDFELNQDGTADGVPDMVDPGPELVGQPLIQSAAGLSNGSEAVVLFFWDGQSDLVQDVDIVQWRASGASANTLYPNKTGVSIDGPDPDHVASTYLNDTGVGGQDVASSLATANDPGLTVSRVDFTEGNEHLTNGNGITGHDETSENLSATWHANTEPSIGSPGAFGPPSLLAGAARAADRFELLFSRALDAASAQRASAYTVLEVLTSGGEATALPLAVASATLAPDGRTVLLQTDPQVPLALYEVRVSSVLAEGGREGVAPGTRVLVRGFNATAGVRLDLPHRPFVPQIDGEVEITYVAPQGQSVLVRVFDGQGREVFVVAEETAPAGGLRTLRWDGRDRLRQRVPAGVYFVHLEIRGTGQETAVPLVVAVAQEGSIR
ncbi:MAG: hypothetical protein U0167_03570 [bacterium]